MQLYSQSIFLFQKHFDNYLLMSLVLILVQKDEHRNKFDSHTNNMTSWKTRLVHWFMSITKVYRRAMLLLNTINIKVVVLISKGIFRTHFRHHVRWGYRYPSKTATSDHLGITCNDTTFFYKSFHWIVVPFSVHFVQRKPCFNKAVLQYLMSFNSLIYFSWTKTRRISRHLPFW